jgi:hypothetical protein
VSAVGANALQQLHGLTTALPYAILRRRGHNLRLEYVSPVV